MMMILVVRIFMHSKKRITTTQWAAGLYKKNVLLASVELKSFNEIIK